MTLPNFDYVAPTTLTEACTRLDSTPDSIPLAGGQRLVPQLRRRCRRPALLVDVTRIDQLRGIVDYADGTVELRAGVTLDQAGAHPAVVRRTALAEAVAAAPDPQIRNRATVGGAVHARSRGDLAAALIALDAQIETAGVALARRVGAARFLGAGDARRPDRLITAVHLPATVRGGSAYERVADRATYAPICGVAVAGFRYADGSFAVRIGLTGAGPLAVRLREVEFALAAGAPVGEAAELAARAEIDVTDDRAAGADYRRHLAGVLLTRALGRLPTLSPR